MNPNHHHMHPSSSSEGTQQLRDHVSTAVTVFFPVQLFPPISGPGPVDREQARRLQRVMVGCTGGLAVKWGDAGRARDLLPRPGAAYQTQNPTSYLPSGPKAAAAGSFS